MVESHTGEITSIILMAIALSMDAFSISLGMGMQQLRLKRIALIGLVFGIFHIVLPFSGIGVGKLLSVRIGHYTALAGGILLLTIGLLMVLNVFTETDTKKVTNPYGIGLFILAISVSMDSFPVGLSLGLSGVKTVLALISFGILSACFTWTGLLIGRKVKGIFGVYSDIFGGSILVAFGLKMIFMN